LTGVREWVSLEAVKSQLRVWLGCVGVALLVYAVFGVLSFWMLPGELPAVP
jgi:hypothetical protein